MREPMQSPISAPQSPPDCHSAQNKAILSPVGLELATEARTWLGTPFQDQGKIKGVGVNCLQMIFQTIIAVVPSYEYLEKEIPQGYDPMTDGALLRQVLRNHTEFIETPDRAPGDIISFCDEALREPSKPVHLVFVEEVTPATTFVINPTENGVRRHRLNVWFNLRITGVWRIRPA